VVLAGLVFLAFGAAFGRGLQEKAWFTIVAVAGGYLGGRPLGRAVAYGTLGVFLRRHGHEPVARPGHLDGAAGLKPVGDFYFFQAMVLAIPAVFLAVWWAVIPLLGRYTNWRQSYLALLTVALAGEIMAFLVPMWSFHRVMKLQKEICLREADEISREVSDLQLRLMSTEAEEEREAINHRLSLRMDRYSAIDAMPTWPLDSGTRRRFTINNLALCLPLLSRVLNLSDSWKEFVDGIQRILSA
jgi:hypothetical protein